MNKKDEIQRSIINEIIKNNFKGIILASVRSGKTRQLLTSIKNIVKIILILKYWYYILIQIFDNPGKKSVI